MGVPEFQQDFQRPQQQFVPHQQQFQQPQQQQFVPQQQQFQQPQQQQFVPQSPRQQFFPQQQVQPPQQQFLPQSQVQQQIVQQQPVFTQQPQQQIFAPRTVSSPFNPISVIENQFGNIQRTNLATQTQPFFAPQTQQIFSPRTVNSPLSPITKIESQFINPIPINQFVPQQQPQKLINPAFDTIAAIENQFTINQQTIKTSPLNQLLPSASSQVPAVSTVPKFCTFRGTLRCDPNSPYRTLDGSCNNLKNLWWGKTDMPFKRYLKPSYSDGMGEPRVSIDGSELPNPRELTCNLHTDNYDIEQFVTHMFMQWGQLVNHDITSLAVSKDEEKNISVCKSCKRTEKCMPILINPNSSGSCATTMRHGCIEFARSSAAFPDTDCSSNLREQINLATSFLDGSFIYGLSDDNLELLRDRKNPIKGQMILQNNGLLPKDTKETPSDCLDFTHDTRCFRAGDDRVNQNPGLMSLHTIFVREHNRIAQKLSEVNLEWSEDIVFQETRKVIIAMSQHITYNEYLPLLLGQQTATKLGLLTGIDASYDSNVDPRVANEYAAGAGRFGHSAVRSLYSRLNKDFKSGGSTSYMLRNTYFRANFLYDVCQGGLESVVRGFLKDPLMKIDRFFSDDLTKHLFETMDDMGHAFNFDLVSINIQRGRDHGLPSYKKFREFCGLSPVRTWDDLNALLPVDVVNTYKSFYRFVDDVDLFTAMVSENKASDALVGQTVQCILGKQFRDLKFGDRFWYETNQDGIGFSPAQLNEIRSASLSKLLCRTMIDTPNVQPKAMLSTKFPNNDLVSCSTLLDFNWSLWRAQN